MGFELMNIITTGNFSILEPFDSENLSLPLDFKEEYAHSRIFGKADKQIIDILSQQSVTLNNHVWGVPPSSYVTDSKLRTFYKVLSTSVDRNNKVFVSTIEAVKYPFYALQWHAEKPLFEWNPVEVINHSTDSVMANQYIADFFVSEARKSMHKFSSPKEEYSSLIYNYQPTYTASFDQFDQIYFFK